jgi:hypothetical protein
MTEASTAILDFRKDETMPDPPPRDLSGTKEPMTYGARGGIIGRPATSASQKQIRQRARRKLRKLTPEEQETLWGKDIQHWDAEELARGRPRDKNGLFQGKAPGFISRQMHEEIISRFEQIVRQEMNGHTVDALKILGMILNDTKTDNKGRPIVPATAKLDAAKFLIEHIIGKPKQRVESDISVKLQGILGHAIANPVQANDGTTSYQLASSYLALPAYNEDNDDISDE